MQAKWIVKKLPIQSDLYSTTNSMDRVWQRNVTANVLPRQLSTSKFLPAQATSHLMLAGQSLVHRMAWDGGETEHNNNLTSNMRNFQSECKFRIKPQIMMVHRHSHLDSRESILHISYSALPKCVWINCVATAILTSHFRCALLGRDISSGEGQTYFIHGESKMEMIKYFKHRKNACVQTSP
jgi:hypothetical protein